jgi:hypothetical protein
MDLKKYLQMTLVKEVRLEVTIVVDTDLDDDALAGAQFTPQEFAHSAQPWADWLADSTGDKQAWLQYDIEEAYERLHLDDQDKDNAVPMLVSSDEGEE